MQLRLVFLSLPHMNDDRTDSWISALSETDLLEIVDESPRFRTWDLTRISIDDAGDYFMSRGGAGAREEPRLPYWEQLKDEFRILICTREKKYESLRKELGSTQKKSQTVVVSVIAATMADQFGVAVGVITPFCALCLVAIVRLGKEAFCASKSLQVTVRPRRPSKPV